MTEHRSDIALVLPNFPKVVIAHVLDVLEEHAPAALQSNNRFMDTWRCLEHTFLRTLALLKGFRN